MPDEGKCKSCNRPILWIKGAITGRGHACDPRPLTVFTTAGQKVQLDTGEVIDLRAGSSLQAHVAHELTCPKPKETR